MSILAVLDQVSCANTAWATRTPRHAHHAMQVHLDCTVGECPAKTHAWRMLVRLGHIRPDSGRPRS
ncbi:hypothetical protein DFR74_112181 [Nocardia puris]|uniref:Uncharacterized protein n=1 Tax=Nocardia puris TaxID=208602 RepID=A0A366DC58_9NOCA|nr:hypothetical protein DFR74_112181 [Nocardia puris]